MYIHIFKTKQTPRSCFGQFIYIYITSPAEPLGLINIDAASKVGQKVQATEEQKNSCHFSHFFDKLKLFSIWPFVKY